MPKYLTSLVAAGVAAALLSACQPQTTEAVQTKAPEAQVKASEAAQPGVDYHSLSNPDQVKISHLALDLTVDFDQHIIKGAVTLDFNKIKADADTLVLDTRALTIEKVEADGMPVAFEMGKTDEHLGTPLNISLPEKGNQVTVYYHTSPEASGVQWLTPEQTAGKQHPFLFTQAQAIHARSFIPLQDSPSVRVTYTATIHTPKDLLAVMSASNDPQTERDGVYEFNMPQAIPTYLIALAVGDLEFKAMGKRTGVYAEPSLLDASAKEFEDTEKMLEATEKQFGPYRWDRYDLLILPPSFPFGGMENPRLSFITPTVIAGDKSLVSLIAHELAHSWSGNTVTNATWRDLWLNEGFTTYLTYRIMEIVYGEDRFNMEAVLGYKDLQDDVDALEEADERLAIDLQGRDPDDVFSDIPYEKGALMLREIEQTVGRAAFDKFLMNYFDHFTFQSITTEQFLTYLEGTLLKDHAELSEARIKQWIYQPGIPDGAPVPHSDAFVKVDNAREQWLAGDISAADIDTSNWTYHQWKHFLNKMPEKLSVEQLAELDAAMGLTKQGNNEILHSWLLICVNNEYKPAYPTLHKYLVRIGRNKLVKPLYAALAKTEEGKAFGKAAFEEAKPGYHPLTVKANEGFFE